jgi:hypothetical protein
MRQKIKHEDQYDLVTHQRAIGVINPEEIQKWLIEGKHQ